MKRNRIYAVEKTNTGGAKMKNVRVDFRVIDRLQGGAGGGYYGKVTPSSAKRLIRATKGMRRIRGRHGTTRWTI